MRLRPNRIRQSSPAGAVATTDHPDAISGNTQCALILSALLLEKGQWVAMPKLAEASGAFAVHSRISDLRKRGNHIVQRNEYGKRPDGTTKVKSFYKLVGKEAA